MAEQKDVLVEKRGALGLITLNRPQALNSLTLTMAQDIQEALHLFESMPTIKHVAIRGAGDKAFCAGGDVRLLHDLGKAGKHEEACEFWRIEYRLNRHIHYYSKPYIAFMDGIVMGGGAGLSVHGKYRLGGEKLVFAMPEVTIGFFPDVGATYFLPRLEGAFGLYLALTGRHIKRADALHLGLITHSIATNKQQEITDRLALGEDITALMPHFGEDPGVSSLISLREKINSYFQQPSLSLVFSALKAGQASGDAFAKDVIEQMNKKSFTSMAIAFEQMQRGKHMNFEDAMRAEFRIASRVIRGKDFYAGVSSALITKDQNPHWLPDKLEDIDNSHIAAYFDRIEDELTFPDLPGVSEDIHSKKIT